MTKIDDLNASVAKAAEKVEKCKKTIERHEAQLEKKIQVLIKAGFTRDQIDNDIDSIKWPVKGQAGGKFYWEACEVTSKLDDIKGATRKLKDAEAILENWKARLTTEINKEKFLSENVPQVIKDFLNEWEDLALEWHIERIKAFKKRVKETSKQVYEAMKEAVKTLPDYVRYLDENGEVHSYYDNGQALTNVWPRKPMEEFLLERNLDGKTISERRMAAAGSAFVVELAGIKDAQVRLDRLEKELDLDKKAKMLDLVYRIQDTVGEITDATGLSVRGGNLNGIIIGDKGEAKVETIGAGGYNIQCFHYRTLIHKLKETK